MTSSREKLPGPVNAIEVAEAKYKSKSSSKKILKPEVTSAWYIATEIVPPVKSKNFKEVEVKEESTKGGLFQFLQANILSDTSS